MLTRIHIQQYKSLYDTTVDLEPLTVFIGPNGSGKSNICESLSVLSKLIGSTHLEDAISQLSDSRNWISKFWQGKREDITFEVAIDNVPEIMIRIDQNGEISYGNSPDPHLLMLVKQVATYDFTPKLIAQVTKKPLTSTGQGIANGLATILFDNRDRFVEMEQRFVQFVPNISRITLKQEENVNALYLVDKYSDYYIPASDVSDGTLRILAFLVALYDINNPQIICFEEPENGVHPWLLHKMMELLNLVSTEGIGGKPVQVLITTHSPVLLNYVKPEQVRVVELDRDGKTQVHKLPLKSAYLKKAMEAYKNQIGELWFTNVIGGNPE